MKMFQYIVYYLNLEVLWFIHIAVNYKILLLDRGVKAKLVQMLLYLYTFRPFSLSSLDIKDASQYHAVFPDTQSFITLVSFCKIKKCEGIFFLNLSHYNFSKNYYFSL